MLHIKTHIQMSSVSPCPPRQGREQITLYLYPHPCSITSSGSGPSPCLWALTCCSPCFYLQHNLTALKKLETFRIIASASNSCKSNPGESTLWRGTWTQRPAKIHLWGQTLRKVLKPERECCQTSILLSFNVSEAKLQFKGTPKVISFFLLFVF